MQNEEHLTPAEREFEEALGRVKPAGTSIDRDLLIFHAGQMSARRRSRLWRITTGVLIVVLGCLLWNRPSTEPTERVVYVEVEQPKPRKTALPAAALATLEWRINGEWHELKLD